MKVTRFLVLIFLFPGHQLRLLAQNDLQVLGDAVFTPQEIASGADVLFLIRFENTGSDTAYNVVVRDTLDPRFDANTVEVIDASHGYQLLRDQGFVRWYFNGIRLPSNNEDGPGNSNASGYVLFKVQPHRFLLPGQSIQNRACISFDDNGTFCTNYASIWLEEDQSGTEEPKVFDRGYVIVPNPNRGQFSVQQTVQTKPNPDDTVKWWICDMNGKTVYDGSSSDLQSMPEQVLLERPCPGLYMLWVKNNGKLQVEQFAVIR